LHIDWTTEADADGPDLVGLEQGCADVGDLPKDSFGTCTGVDIDPAEFA
jgi:hypothetical protein